MIILQITLTVQPITVLEESQDTMKFSQDRQLYISITKQWKMEKPYDTWCVATVYKTSTDLLHWPTLAVRDKYGFY
jgi:hypothetical protein